MTDEIKLRPYGATFGREHDSQGYVRPETLTVDCHAHMFVAEADELVRPHYPASTLSAVKFASEESRIVNIEQNKERMPLMESADARLIEMDRMGIDLQVISPVPSQFNYHTDVGLCCESSRMINEKLSYSANKSPRLIALGTVPLQDCSRAIDELDYCISKLAMSGIEVGASVGNEELSSPRLDSFWARVEELGTTVLLHPTSFASNRLSAHYFTNVIGNPLETTVAAAHLIMDGVMERYQELKIILAHGGAYAPQFASRMDHAWGARKDCRGRIANQPSEYLSKFYFDTIVFANDQLEFLLGRFGRERLLIGTDYAFDMGEYDPLELVLTTSNVDRMSAELICGLNAVRLFEINVETAGRTGQKRLKPNL